MNTEHINQWVHEMRTTDKPQGARRLARVRESTQVVEYCCLGLGCELMGLDPVRLSGDSAVRFGESEQVSLAPREFVEWLGLDLSGFMNPSARAYDVTIDYPPGLMFIVGVVDFPAFDHPDACDVGTAASLNDSGFTFTQIADIVAYFGIREATS